MQRRSSFSSKACSSNSKVVETTTLAKTKWVALQTLKWIDPEGKERQWDACSRSTKKETNGIDAVCVFARVIYADKPTEVVLVRQFRPPLGCQTIELPAGLIDVGETPLEAAKRELKEETGYVAKNVSEANVATCLSPGLSDEKVKLVFCEVDGDSSCAGESGAQHQSLEESEFVTVIKVPLNQLRKSLDELNAEGHCVFAGLYMMALGMELAR